MAKGLKKKYLIFEEKEFRQIKLLPQQYDINFWEEFIVNGKEEETPKTLSQKRIKEAYTFFKEELEGVGFEKLQKIREKLENSLIGVLELTNEREASSIFELQNDRGKRLTDLEKVKAFLMYQILTSEGNSQDIGYIYREFERIYQIINSPNFPNEDSILSHYLQAYRGYRIDEEKVPKLKKEIKGKKGAERISFIKGIAKGLRESFEAMEEFLKDDREIAYYLRDLQKEFNFSFAYPFLIKSYNLFRENPEKLEKILFYLEKIVFIHNLANTRAKIGSRLHPYLKKFRKETEPEELFNEIYHRLTREYYWTERQIKGVLAGDMNQKLTRYILKRYEIHLRKGSKEGYPSELYTIDIYKGKEEERKGWWIEHIAPQTENREGDSGYESYDKDFLENYLNSLGNLILTSEEHNRNLGNRKFSQKLASYKNSPMLHHREVAQFAEEGRWTKRAIEERGRKIGEFILEEWGLERNFPNRSGGK